MGTSTYQIATANNVALKRINPGYSGTHCVTKSDITPIEFLEVKNRSTSISNTLYTDMEGVGNVDMDCTMSNGYTVNYYSVMSTIENTSKLAFLGGTSGSLYIGSTSYLLTMNLDFPWPSSYSDMQDNSLYYYNITTTPGKRYDWNINLTYFMGCVSSPGNISELLKFSPSYVNYTVGFVVLDANNNYITQYAPMSYSTSSLNNKVSFTATTSSTKLCCILVAVNGSTCYPNTTGYKYPVVGFYVSDTVTRYDSYYDQTYKCVQYADINHPTGKTFTIYYGVWNNKSSNAKLDTLNVQIKKSTDSSWTTIGTTSLPSSLNSSTTGSVTCTLPSSYDPTVAYDFRVTAGQTTYNQKWYYRWGSQSSLTTSGYSWTTYSSSAKTGVCSTTYGLNGTSAYSVLENHDTSGTTLNRGRSSSYAALFCIE